MAAKCRNEQEARRVYTALSGSLKQQGFDAYVSRLSFEDGFSVGLIADCEESHITQDIAQTIHQYLGQGQICQLAPQALALLEQRRRNKQRRQEDREKQMRFLQDPAVYLAELEEMLLKAPLPESSPPLDSGQNM